MEAALLHVILGDVDIKVSYLVVSFTLMYAYRRVVAVVVLIEEV